ncbi:hypothetical protein [uncultured Pseudodesulfovibrio sp.]|uniref:hypothetical protein n=1 Tax=uncultured Pseudodesulfovibrio sp. TaxID=2035858 RepID=UPI0029C81F57|nr:hypothetical protein [uncultured Pseudodesulfovibrio sp.]
MQNHKHIISSFDAYLVGQAKKIIDGYDLQHFKQTNASSKPIEAICILDKFCRSRVTPTPKRIVFSACYLKQKQTLPTHLAARTEELESLIKQGSPRINKTKPRSDSFISDHINRLFDKRGFICDFMLYDLNVIHFNIASNKKKEDSLVFAIIDKEDAYFICIGTHRDLYNSQEHSKVIDVLSEEYPDYIEKWMPKIRGIDPSTEHLDTSQVKKMKLSGVNAMILDSNGDLRASVHGMLSCARTPMLPMTNLQRIISELIQISDHLLITNFRSDFSFIGLEYNDSKPTCIFKPPKSMKYTYCPISPHYTGLLWLLDLFIKIELITGKNYRKIIPTIDARAKSRKNKKRLAGKR